jgi:hypothetical protein
VNALKTSVKTDVKTSDLAKLLALAESVDTRNIRSYVFAPSYYAIEYVTSPRGYIITPRVSRIRAAVKEAFSVDPAVIALRDRLAAEAAQVWVLNASGRTGLASTLADYLAYSGVEASAPNRRTATIAKTKVVVYNGGEGAIPDTIAYLEDVFDVTATMVTDPAVTADVIVSAGRDAPNLEIEPPG